MDNRLREALEKIASLELSVTHWKGAAQNLQRALHIGNCADCLQGFSGTETPVKLHENCFRRLQSLSATTAGERCTLTQLQTADRHMAEFLRKNYSLEIGNQEIQHRGEALDAAIHYMLIERRRWRVRLCYLLRWVMGGGQ